MRIYPSFQPEEEYSVIMYGQQEQVSQILSKDQLEQLSEAYCLGVTNNNENDIDKVLKL